MNSNTDMVDKYDRYNFDYDKKLFCNHSGKQRSKREAEEHTNKHDPCGHTRKLEQKFHNTEMNRRKSESK